MRNPMETLFDTCKELLGKRPVTYGEFVLECQKDAVLGEGVEAICHAMVKYNEPCQYEANQLSVRLQEALATINVLRGELASMKESSVIPE